MKTVYLLVIDAFGVGGAPDAAAYGDEGSNTYRAVAPYINTYFLDKMGLKLAAGERYDGGLVGMCGRMTEKSKGSRAGRRNALEYLSERLPRRCDKIALRCVGSQRGARQLCGERHGDY